jgi:hypothetical protein
LCGSTRRLFISRICKTMPWHTRVGATPPQHRGAAKPLTNERGFVPMDWSTSARRPVNPQEHLRCLRLVLARFKATWLYAG